MTISNKISNFVIFEGWGVNRSPPPQMASLNKATAGNKVEILNKSLKELKIRQIILFSL